MRLDDGADLGEPQPTDLRPRLAATADDRRPQPEAPEAAGDEDHSTTEEGPDNGEQGGRHHVASRLNLRLS